MALFIFGVLCGVAMVLFYALLFLKAPDHSEGTILMPQIELDATKPVIFRNPVVRKLKDKEGSPIVLDPPIPVENWTGEIQNATNNFGSIEAQSDGSIKFNPGDEIDGEATGDIHFNGTFSHTPEGETEAQTFSATQVYNIALRAGAPEGPQELDVELEVVQE